MTTQPEGEAQPRGYFESRAFLDIEAIEDAKFIAMLDRLLGERVPDAFKAATAPLLLDSEHIIHLIYRVVDLAGFSDEGLEVVTGNPVRDNGRAFERLRRSHKISLSTARTHLRASLDALHPAQVAP